MTSWRRGLAIVVGVAAVLMAALLYANMDDGTSRKPKPPSTPDTLRLSGSQFLLNWQSFSGRRVLVEFCTIQVIAERGAACLVFDGSRRLGEIDIEGATFDPVSSAWARKTCMGNVASTACSIRLSGIIRRGTDGRPLLDRAEVVL